jgi:hypothetical protein
VIVYLVFTFSDMCCGLISVGKTAMAVWIFIVTMGASHLDVLNGWGLICATVAQLLGYQYLRYVFFKHRKWTEKAHLPEYGENVGTLLAQFYTVMYPGLYQLLLQYQVVFPLFAYVLGTWFGIAAAIALVCLYLLQSQLPVLESPNRLASWLKDYHNQTPQSLQRPRQPLSTAAMNMDQGGHPSGSFPSHPSPLQTNENPMSRRPFAELMPMTGHQSSANRYDQPLFKERNEKEQEGLNGYDRGNMLWDEQTPHGGPNNSETFPRNNRIPRYNQPPPVPSPPPSNAQFHPPYHQDQRSPQAFPFFPTDNTWESSNARSLSPYPQPAPQPQSWLNRYS